MKTESTILPYGTMPEDQSASGTEWTITRPSKHYKTHYGDTSCIICGSRYIDHGRILHGHCVCEDCVDYIASADPQTDTGE